MWPGHCLGDYVPTSQTFRGQSTTRPTTAQPVFTAKFGSGTSETAWVPGFGLWNKPKIKLSDRFRVLARYRRPKIEQVIVFVQPSAGAIE
jgi:hypothetical protein